jgi:hypothetical protein
VEHDQAAAREARREKRVKEKLWDKDGDGLDVGPSRQPHARRATERHIGCPLSWFTQVFPIVRGKNELAIALYLYRLRVVCRSRTVVVSNNRLLAELKIDRYAKYRALSRLAAAGVITVRRRNKRALEVVFPRSGPRSR